MDYKLICTNFEMIQIRNPQIKCSQCNFCPLNGLEKFCSKCGNRYNYELHIPIKIDIQNEQDIKTNKQNPEIINKKKCLQCDYSPFNSFEKFCSKCGNSYNTELNIPIKINNQNEENEKSEYSESYNESYSESCSESRCELYCACFIILIFLLLVAYSKNL
jgi:hypothetical protein